MNRENRVVRQDRENAAHRTVVRTTTKKAVRNARNACAAAVSCSTAGPQKAVSLTAYFGAYRTTPYTRGRKWYDRLNISPVTARAFQLKNPRPKSVDPLGTAAAGSLPTAQNEAGMNLDVAGCRKCGVVSETWSESAQVGQNRGVAIDNSARYVTFN
jgi:hypothetical protein